MNRRISPYIITWVEIRAQKGVVRREDQEKILGKYSTKRRAKAVFKHFENKDKALWWLKSFNTPLIKHYECRLFTDAQFARAVIDYDADKIIVPFTKMQRNNVYYI